MLTEDYQKCQEDKSLLKAQYNTVVITAPDLKDDNKKVKFYTGLPLYTVLMAIFNLIITRK